MVSLAHSAAAFVRCVLVFRDAFPLISAGGIDVLHVNHHGSESSTNMNYMNKAEPAVAIVGDGETSGWDLPRTYLLDDVATPDTTAPTVALTAPANGATVSGPTTVTATASDDRGVVRVEFYLDGALMSTSATAPYSWSWNTTFAANGSHALSALAYDAAGNTGTSAAVNVTVSNTADTTPPSAPSGLRLTPGAGKMTLSWTASTDNVGVTGYQIWRATSASGPFTQVSTSTAPSFVDTGLARRTTYYYVKAFDAAGNVSAASATASARTK